MGSIFTTSNRNKLWNLRGDKQWTQIPFFMQFVPGVVTDVVTSNQHYAYGHNQRNINSILAKPHITDELLSKRKGTFSESENRYIPLFRGMVDVPATGDPVLLCKIGNVQYYLGPLNPENNVFFNKDHLDRKEAHYKINTFDHRDYSKANQDGKSQSLLGGANRVQKQPNILLDNPAKHMEPDIWGDMVFEGRTGNSIRLGQRGPNPLIFISNGRTPNNPTESPLDGSFLAMIEDGSLRTHFPDMYVITERDEDPESETFREVIATESRPFLYSSDHPVLENNRSLSSMMKFIYGGRESYDPTSILYEYGGKDFSETLDPEPIAGSQLFMTSDRIIINSKRNDIFLSSFDNIHIATGDKVTISTNNETIIESKNIYLGKESKDKHDNNEEPEPIVLGRQLNLVLGEILDILMEFRVMGTFGGESGTPALKILGKLETLKNKISDPNTNAFLSKFHYIESNEVEK